MDIDKSNEEAFLNYINRELKATIQIAPFADLINFAYGDISNCINELNLPVETTVDQLFSYPTFRERVNRDFDVATRYSTIIELANFAFGNYRNAVDAFLG